MAKHGIRKHFPSRSRKAGMPPGSLVYIGPEQAEPKPARMTVIEYDGDTLTEREIQSIDAIFPLKSAPIVTWVNINSVHNEPQLAEIGERFQLNALLLEDILNTEQRPKCDHADGLIYLFLKIFDFHQAQEEISNEQVSMVVGPNFLLTFMEEIDNEFEPIRARLRSGNKKLRCGGPGLLAYSLLDTIVDSYFLVLEKIGERLGEIEESLSEDQPPNILQNVHRLKRELIFLRKHIWPVREVITNLQHGDSELVNGNVQLYLRDVYDHTIQVMDTLETYRDLLGGIQDLYLSVLSYRMNDVMKVLTVMSSIFIPLTFLVGVYGMNFKYMPELQQPWGYPALWVLMILIACAMGVYFRHKRWI